MAFIADRTISPTSKLIVNYLTGKSKPESLIQISDAVGASHWTSGVLCKSLVAMGHLTLTLVGKSPHYSVVVPKDVPK